jgi:hypothetical protein
MMRKPKWLFHQNGKESDYNYAGEKAQNGGFFYFGEKRKSAQSDGFVRF